MKKVSLKKVQGTLPKTIRYMKQLGKAHQEWGKCIETKLLLRKL
jgi:hypothetical protein